MDLLGAVKVDHIRSGMFLSSPHDVGRARVTETQSDRMLCFDEACTVLTGDQSTGTVFHIITEAWQLPHVTYQASEDWPNLCAPLGA